MLDSYSSYWLVRGAVPCMRRTGDDRLVIQDDKDTDHNESWQLAKCAEIEKAKLLQALSCNMDTGNCSAASLMNC